MNAELHSILYFSQGKPLRVAIALNKAWNIYNFRASLITALKAAGHEVVGIAPADDYAPRLAILGCEFVDIEMEQTGTNPLKDLRLCLAYVRIFRRLRPDVLLTYTMKPNIYASLAARAVGIPVINNISGLGYAFINSGLVGRIVKGLLRLSLLRSNVVFFQNRDDHEMFLTAGVVRHWQARLVPGSGIDLARFSADPPEDNGNGPLRFLLIARLLREKGIVEFAEAARLIRARGIAAHFEILGFLDPDNRAGISRQLLQEWVESGLVRYLGHTDDVRQFIRAADCVVLPSYREGAPRTLLEAGAMSRPLIAADVPGCRDVVEHEVNGFLSPARSAEGLADAIHRFVTLSAPERRTMGLASRSKIAREFSEDLVLDAYLRAVREVTGKTGA